MIVTVFIHDRESGKKKGGGGGGIYSRGAEYLLEKRREDVGVASLGISFMI